MLVGLYAPQMGSGKTEIAHYLCDNGFEIVSFAEPIKDMISVLADSLRDWQSYWEPFDFAYGDKTQLIPGTDKTLRHALQTLGTEWGRNLVDQDLWIKCAEHTLSTIQATFQPSNVVIDDLRFPNEYDWIKSKGGFVVKVIRPTAKGLETSHASEGSLDNFEFDAIINNDGTLDDLHIQIQDFVNKLSV